MMLVTKLRQWHKCGTSNGIALHIQSSNIDSSNYGRQRGFRRLENQLQMLYKIGYLSNEFLWITEDTELQYVTIIHTPNFLTRCIEIVLRDPTIDKFHGGIHTEGIL